MCIEEQTTKSTEKTKQYMNKEKKKNKPKPRDFELLQNKIKTNKKSFFLFDFRVAFHNCQTCRAVNIHTIHTENSLGQ